MIKAIAIIVFILIWLGLNRVKKNKYQDKRNRKVNLIKRYFFVPILGLLYGIAGALLIRRYPNIDPNIDLPFIGFIFLFLFIDESIDFLILNGNGNWFFTKNRKV